MKIALSFCLFSFLTIGSARAQTLDQKNFNSCLKLEIEKDDGNKYICSGVAISDTLVLTAAHCLLSSKSIRITSEDMLIDFSASSFAIHPQYDRNRSKYLYDLALVFLPQQLPTNLILYPIYPGHVDQAQDVTLYRCGFGLRDGNNLRAVISPMKIIYADENYFEIEDLFSFPGDSGGPIFMLKNNQFWLVGIQSTKEFERSLNPLVHYPLF